MHGAEESDCAVVPAAKKIRAKLQAIKEQLRRRMHEPLKGTGKWLESVVRGYFQYHAVPGNTPTLGVFRERLKQLWRQVIRRRGQQHRSNWNRLGSAPPLSSPTL